MYETYCQCGYDSDPDYKGICANCSKPVEESETEGFG